jgi:hypothetical protein
MFVGHYSASFLGKALAPRVPLWVFLIAAQLVDVAWAVLVLLGVERFHLDPTLPSNPLVLEHMPYTHSLVASFAWAGLAALALWAAPRIGTARAAVAVGLVVLSHWVLDLVVHRPDLTLWGSEPRLGLGLWNQPGLAFGLEVLLLAGAAGFYTVYRRVDEPLRRAVVRGVGVLVVVQTLTTLGPLPPSPTALVIFGLTTFLGVAYAAARTEHRLTIPTR